MNFQSLLIVTYGRSGSTLLQGLCNALPGCVVRGENYNFCHGLYHAWQQLKRARSEFGGAGSHHPEDPWYGAHALDPQAFMVSARSLVERQLMGPSLVERPACLGFKEIRYLPDVLGGGAADYPQRLAAYLDFLAELMPHPAILFLTRDAEQVARSAWWQHRDPAEVRRLLALFGQAAADYRHPRCPTFLLSYADLVANNERVGQLFEFLGVLRSPELVRQVLGRAHSYATPEPATPAPVVAAVPSPSAEPQFHLISPLPDPMALVAPDQPRRVGEPSAHTFRWDGVAVALPGPSGLSLALQTPAGLVPLEWGRTSPWAAAQLPDNPLAAKARYRGPVFRLRPGESCTLMLQQPAEPMRPLARLQWP